jgi:hypothetical protein
MFQARDKRKCRCLDCRSWRIPFVKLTKKVYNLANHGTVSYPARPILGTVAWMGGLLKDKLRHERRLGVCMWRVDESGLVDLAASPDGLLEYCPSSCMCTTKLHLDISCSPPVSVNSPVGFEYPLTNPLLVQISKNVHTQHPRLSSIRELCPRRPYTRSRSSNQRLPYRPSRDILSSGLCILNRVYPQGNANPPCIHPVNHRHSHAIIHQRSLRNNHSSMVHFSSTRCKERLHKLRVCTQKLVFGSFIRAR